MKWEKKNLRRLFCLALCACLLLPLAAAAQDDPVVVRVGATTYSREKVQAYWNYIAESAAAMGVQIDASNVDDYVAVVLESFVDMGVLENKFIELGLYKMTRSEEKQVEEAAKEIFAQLESAMAEQIAEQYHKTVEETQPYVPMMMELNGYTMALAREQAMNDFKEQRMLDYVAGDSVTLTDEAVEAFYNENFVEPSREAYENDIESFERDVLYYGTPVYWIPEGYRYARHILLKAADDTADRLTEKEQALAEAEAALETLSNKLYGLKLLEEDTAQAQADYDETAARCAALRAELAAIREEALSLHADTIAVIEAKLAKGVDFETLMETYNQDEQMPEEGYMVSANSLLWAKEFILGAMAPKKLGDVSGPFVTSGGVHFFEYTSDAPAGAVAFEGEVKAQMTEFALNDRKTSILKAWIDTWKEDYEIETDASLLETPASLNLT